MEHERTDAGPARDARREQTPEHGERGPSRRGFLKGSSVAAAGVAAGIAARPTGGAAQAPADPREGIALDLTVNGRAQSVRVDARTTLADLLRERLGLTGTKIGCNHGQCGACTVQVDGVRVLSCLTLAATLPGAEVTTIEGLAPRAEAEGIADDGLHPVQAAFARNDALQCGYCTPGQIMSAEACIREGHAATDAAIQEYMSGNLCRCAAYPNIVAAIGEARDAMALDPPPAAVTPEPEWHAAELDLDRLAPKDITGLPNDPPGEAFAAPTVREG